MPNLPETRVVAGVVALPPNQVINGRRVDLNSLEAVSREMARLYRDARRGTLPTVEASRLTFILSSLAKLIESAELERRLTELEELVREQHADQD